MDTRTFVYIYIYNMYVHVCVRLISKHTHAYNQFYKYCIADQTTLLPVKHTCLPVKAIFFAGKSLLFLNISTLCLASLMVKPVSSAT